jgi:hypothetical protein
LFSATSSGVSEDVTLGSGRQAVEATKRTKNDKRSMKNGSRE